MQQIKVSIITIVYNGSKFIEQTIQSVLNQTYKNIEYIIIDGGSTDGTIEIIKKYENNLAYWISEPDNGIADAFNKGIKLANGELIGLINASDWYDSNCIENIVKVYQNNKNSVVYGNVVFCNDNGDVKLKGVSNIYKILFYMSIAHQGVFVPKHIYTTYGLFNINIKIAMDYELMLRYFVNNVSFIKCNEYVAYYREGGVSNKNIFKSLKEMYFAQKYNIKDKTIRFLCFIYLIYLYFLSLKSRIYVKK